MTSHSSARNILETRILAPLRTSILLSQDKFCLASREEFGDLFTSEVLAATRNFCCYLGAAELMDLDRQLRVTFYYRILSAINGALGKACPRIAALVYFRAEGSIQVAAIRRDSLPADVAVGDDIVPFIDYKSESDIDEGRNGILCFLASEDEFAGKFESSDAPQDGV